MSNWGALTGFRYLWVIVVVQKSGFYHSTLSLLTSHTSRGVYNGMVVDILMQKRLNNEHRLHSWNKNTKYVSKSCLNCKLKILLLSFQMPINSCLIWRKIFCQITHLAFEVEFLKTIKKVRVFDVNNLFIFLLFTFITLERH